MKTRANYSVEEDIKNKFDEVCKDNAINRSAWIEQKMKELIEEYKNKK